MDTRQDMEAELVSQLQVSQNATQFTPTRITDLIQKSYIWCTEQQAFKALQRAKGGFTVLGQDVYDYPEEYRSDTLAEIIYIGGLPYKRKNFSDYQEKKYNDPNSASRIFADYARQYFVSPTPTQDNLAIVLFGQIQAEALDLATSPTIFSYSSSSGNEAVVRKALSVAIKMKNPKLSASEEVAAAGILAKIRSEELAKSTQEQRLDHPVWDVPDFFGGGISGPIIPASNLDQE